MVEEEVKTTITAESVGEDAYQRQADGIRKVGDETKRTNEDLQTAALTNMVLLESLSSLQAGFSATTSGVMYFAGENEALRRVLETMTATMNIVIGALQIYKGASALAATVDWGRAAAGIAANLWLAPVVAGIIAAALVGMYAVQANWMATGGSGIVSEPTLFVAGERGPEHYSFTPVSRGSPGGAISVGTINLTVKTDSPDRIGESVWEYLRKLSGAGR